MFVVAALAIFIWIPQRDPPPIATGESIDPDTPQEPGQSTVEDQGTPFLDSQVRRAQEFAESTLNDFSALQDHFEQNQLGSEQHFARYNEIKDQANQGDILFGQREFETAQRKFEIAVEDLRSLIAEIDFEFDESINAGVLALEELNEEKSRHAFVYAADLKPLEQSPQAGLKRVANLPKINELLRESERAHLRGNWDKALSLISEAEDLDGGTVGLNERRTRILTAQANEELQNLLSSGHQALRQDEFDEADRIFNEVLQRQAGNRAAETGLQETKRSRTLAQISALQSTALEQEKELNLPGALQTYEQALEIDSTLEFAIEGRDRAHTILALLGQMETVLRDQAALSGDDELEEARQLLEDAKEYSSFSREFDQAVAELAAAVELASSYVPVVLISDNATQVTLSTKGSLGVFERRELQLRPGRYQLIGSRDGRMDVRKTIHVEQDMDPISIVCNIEI